MSHPVWYTRRMIIKTDMTIEQRITVKGMELALKAESKDEVTKIAIWANNQLSLVSLWQRTGVKPEGLEFNA